MVRVGVIGAGVAGVAAALEAAEGGASVTVFEASSQLSGSKSSWPSILAGAEAGQSDRVAKALADAAIGIIFGQRVVGVDSAHSLTVGGTKREFDALVLCTGSTAVPEPLAAGRRRGVHILGSWRDFVDLREASGSYQQVALCGAGLSSVDVAEKLRNLGIRVAILAPGGLLSSQLNEAPRRLVLAAVESQNVRVIASKLDRIVGVDKVEAVVAGGAVMPCDAIMVLPKTKPLVPDAPVRLGPSGGVVVADSMESSLAGFFAAGDCAEVKVGSTTLPMMFDSAAESMGRTAGANAAGARVTSNVTGSFFKTLFGLGVASSRLSLVEALNTGTDATEVSRDWKGELACSLVVERRTRVVIGVQLVGKDVSRYADSLPLIVSSGASLEQLAYAEVPYSSDISPITETARGGPVRK